MKFVPPPLNRPNSSSNLSEKREKAFRCANAWEQRKLSDGMTEYTDRVFIEDDQIYKQVTVKNTGEISLRGSQPGRNIGRKRQARVNLRDYPMTLIFTRQTVEQGGIGFAKNDVDGCIVTENMPTIAVDGKKFNQDFLVAFFKTYGFRKDVILSNIEGGTAQIAIHEDDILDSSSTFPSLKEQIKIGNFFRTLSQQITLHQRKWVEFFYPTYFRKFSFLNFWEFFNNRITNAWEQRKLSDLCSMHARIGWQNLRTSEFLDQGQYLLITGTDFDNGSIRFNSCHFVKKERYDQDKNIQVKNGSILITKDGTLGKVAYVENLNKPATLNAGVFNVKTKGNDVDNKYLFQYLKAPFLMKYVDEKSTGGTIKHLNQSILVNFPVVLPGVEEQRKIGEFLSHIDSILTLHQRQSVSSDLLGASLHL